MSEQAISSGAGHSPGRRCLRVRLLDLLVASGAALFLLVQCPWRRRTSSD
ncbi:MAG: hypothetical protein Q4B13_02445 [Lautropia sp.]|nr:hypothetical protein [Lautropia sp.]